MLITHLRTLDWILKYSSIALDYIVEIVGELSHCPLHVSLFRRAIPFFLAPTSPAPGGLRGWGQVLTSQAAIRNRNAFPTRLRVWWAGSRSLLWWLQRRLSWSKPLNVARDREGMAACTKHSVINTGCITVSSVKRWRWRAWGDADKAHISTSWLTEG